MGCKPSKLQIQHNGDLFNEDTDVRKRFLTGLQASKGAYGLEGNFQIVFAKTKRKRYEEVAYIPPPTDTPSLTNEYHICRRFPAQRRQFSAQRLLLDYVM